MNDNSNNNKDRFVDRDNLKDRDNFWPVWQKEEGKESQKENEPEAKESRKESTTLQ